MPVTVPRSDENQHHLEVSSNASFVPWRQTLRLKQCFESVSPEPTNKYQLVPTTDMNEDDSKSVLQAVLAGGQVTTTASVSLADTAGRTMPVPVLHSESSDSQAESLSQAHSHIFISRIRRCYLSHTIS
jgi:hypothetical protein